MPVFEYTHIKTTGREQKGAITAPSLADARRQLRQAGVHVICVTEKGKSESDIFSSRVLQRRTARMHTMDLASGSRHLATLLKAGIPLAQALTALVEQLENSPQAWIFARIRDRVTEGASLADAMSEQVEIFEEVFISNRDFYFSF